MNILEKLKKHEEHKLNINDLIKEGKDNKLTKSDILNIIKDLKYNDNIIEFNGYIYDIDYLKKNKGIAHSSPNMSLWVDKEDKTNDFGISFDSKEKDLPIFNKKITPPGSLVDYFVLQKNNKNYSYIHNVYQNKNVNHLLLKKNNNYYSVNNNIYLKADIDINDNQNNDFKEGDILEFNYFDNQWNFINKLCNINDNSSEAIICQKLANLTQPNNINSTDFDKYNDILVNKKIVDLTHIPFTTIDAFTTKDIDDAIYFDKNNNRLYVAIADVSSFVEKNDTVDLSAKQRATTFYLNNNVIPMINKDLSENLFSLKIGEPKLALTCIIDFNEDYTVKETNFIESKIIVQNKISYKDIDEIILNNNLDILPESSFYRNEKIINAIDLSQKDKEGLKEYFTDYYLFSQNLKKYNNEKSYFFTQTPKYKLNELGKIDFLYIEQENISPAQTIVETSMLSANTSAANFLLKNYPYLGLYRNQEIPEEEVAPKSAQYNFNNSGHYSLDELTYTHFTSPIRRYCDLVIHRLIKSSLNNEIIYTQQELTEIAQNINNKNYMAKQLDIKQKELLMGQYLEKLVKNKELKNKFEIISFNENGILIRNKQLIDVFVPYFKTNREVEKFFKSYENIEGIVLYDIIKLANSKFQLKCFIDKFDYTQDRIDFTLKIYEKSNNLENIEENINLVNQKLKRKTNI